MINCSPAESSPANASKIYRLPIQTPLRHYPAQSLCTVHGEVESLPVQLQDQLSSHVQKRCDKAWRNISNLLNPWRWFTSSGRTRPSSSSSPNVLSTCKPSAVLFFAVTCAKSYSLLFNPAEVGGEFHVYTLNAGSESWIRVRWIMRSYSKLLRIKNLTLSKSWDPKRKTCYYLLFIYIHLQYLFVLFKSFLYFPLRIRPVGRLKTLR